MIDIIILILIGVGAGSLVTCQILHIKYRATILDHQHIQEQMEDEIRQLDWRIKSFYTTKDEPPFTISRKHCMITALEDSAIVTDLGSTLGTFVNGVRLGASKSRPRTTRLKAGTHTITLGLADSGVSFTIHVGESALPPSI